MSCFDLAEAVSLLSEDSASGSAPSVDEESLFLLLEEMESVSALSGLAADMLFTLETVSCLGACGLAPVLTVNDKVYPGMTPDAAAELIHELRGAE